MLAYISHAIMGNELYKKLEHDVKLFKNEVDKDGIKTYSLGIDLSHFIKGVSGDIQHKNTRIFIELNKIYKRK